MEMMLKKDEIELIPLDPTHAKTLFELIHKNRAFIRTWLPWVDGTQTIADTEHFITINTKLLTDKNGIQCGIWFQKKMVGVIGYHFIHKANRKASIGYWLDEDYRGKGIMTTACELLISYGFTHFNLNRVEISCAVENEKSAAIPKRLGFTKEGYFRESEWLYDHFVDQELYSILKSEWNTQKRMP